MNQLDEARMISADLHGLTERQVQLINAVAPEEGECEQHELHAHEVCMQTLRYAIEACRPTEGEILTLTPEFFLEVLVDYHIMGDDVVKLFCACGKNYHQFLVTLIAAGKGYGNYHEVAIECLILDPDGVTLDCDGVTERIRATYPCFAKKLDLNQVGSRDVHTRTDRIKISPKLRMISEIVEHHERSMLILNRISKVPGMWTGFLQTLVGLESIRGADIEVLYLGVCGKRDEKLVQLVRGTELRRNGIPVISESEIKTLVNGGEVNNLDEKLAQISCQEDPTAK